MGRLTKIPFRGKGVQGMPHGAGGAPTACPLQRGHASPSTRQRPAHGRQQTAFSLPRTTCPNSQTAPRRRLS